jgi:site-specific DNA-methyltransferase (adenine-specific)
MGQDWDDFEPREYQKWCEKWAAKTLRVLKPGGHLLAFSGNRTHHRLSAGVEDSGFEIRDTVTWHYGTGFPKNSDTLLKPATEFVTLARSPLSEDTVNKNVQTHGTGALNIDGARVEYESTDDLKQVKSKNPGRNDSVTSQVYGHDRPQQKVDVSGRHPPNVVFDDQTSRELDRGMGKSPGMGPSRYFYTSKSSRKERTLEGKIENEHPTVKPTDLMEWLVRLVTTESQTVLDPFAGTGTTCLSAKNTSRRFIGIEKNPKWADVARVRCGLAAVDPAHVRPGENSGLDDFK